MPKILLIRDSSNFYIASFFEFRKEKIYCLTEKNTFTIIGEEKIEFKFDSLKTFSKNEEILNYFDEVKLSSENIRKEIDIDLLYQEVYSNDNENKEFSVKKLCEIYFGEDFGIDHLYAMFKTLKEDPVYFKYKPKSFTPKPLKTVNEIKEQIKKTEENKRKKKKEREYVKSFFTDFFKFENKKPTELPIEVIKFIEPIRKFIIWNEENENNEEAKKHLNFIRKCGFKFKSHIYETAFDLFEKLGIFSHDENISLLKYNVPTQYEEQSLKDAQDIKPDFSNKNYIDKRSIKTYSIDDRYTKDIDDAISWEKKDDNYYFHIFISDVSAFIKMNSNLDNEALQRGTTVYLPVGKISMFPEILSEKKMSLVANEDKPALTFSIICDDSYNIIEKKISLSLINVDKNLSYNYADEHLNSDTEIGETLSHFYNLSQILKQKRLDNNALIFSNPSIKAYVDENEEIKLKQFDVNSQSFELIREMMIIANNMSAEFLFRNEAPTLYVCQSPPEENINLTENEAKKLNRIELIEIFKKLKKSEISVLPSKHYCLGLDMYTQTTSPIRRYHDLILHRQIKAILLNKELPYTTEEIQKVAATAEATSKETMSIEKESNRYWLLKYLQKKKGSIMEAFIVKKFTNSFLIEIKEVLLMTTMYSSKNLRPGQTINVSIENANPRIGSINVKLAPRYFN